MPAKRELMQEDGKRFGLKSILNPKKLAQVHRQLLIIGRSRVASEGKHHPFLKPRVGRPLVQCNNLIKFGIPRAGSSQPQLPQSGAHADIIAGWDSDKVIIVPVSEPRSTLPPRRKWILLAQAERDFS